MTIDEFLYVGAGIVGLVMVFLLGKQLLGLLARSPHNGEGRQMIELLAEIKAGLHTNSTEIRTALQVNASATYLLAERAETLIQAVRRNEDHTLATLRRIEDTQTRENTMTRENLNSYRVALQEIVARSLSGK